jgi:hypothetical protein
MDSSTQKGNSTEDIRERVESKRDDFAGGPEPGWQTLEATVDETRHEAAQAWSSSGGDDVAGEQERYSTASTEGETQGSIGQADQSVGTDSVPAGATATTGESMAKDEMPPFNDEHPLGVGQQCFTCGAYNDLEAETCWNCSKELTPTMVETPGIVESVQPVGTGETAEGIPTGETTETGSSGGARPMASD